MHHGLLALTVFAFASQGTTAESDPREPARAAIARLSEASGYSWEATTRSAGDERRRDPTRGKHVREGFIHVVMRFRGNELHIVIEKDRAAVTGRDGGWELISLRDTTSGRGGFAGRLARDFELPGVEAAEILSSAGNLTREGDVVSGQLTAEAARSRLSFRRRGDDTPIRDAKGTAKFQIEDGVLAGYELRVTGTVVFDDREIDIDRTTTVEISNVGSTRVEVPRAARETLRGELPEPLDPDVARAILARNGKRDAGVHDPSSIVKCDGEFWFFATGTGVHSWRSRDLKTWERGPRVFPQMPEWVRDVVPTQRGHFWAPDVIRIGERYLLYYSVSRFGVNTSAIALASTPTLNPDDPRYEWTDHGIVVQCDREDDFNTIDPAVISVEPDALWMSFGSYWSGIKLIELDPETGKRTAPDSPMHSLAHARDIEAPHIERQGEYFYLFVNHGRCCRGVDSTYNIRVGRSREITGPYLDREGVDLMDGGGSLLLATDGPFVGPGHASVLEVDGAFWFSCHFYDATERGRSHLAIRPLRWTEDGWPELPPIDAPSASATQDESR